MQLSDYAGKYPNIRFERKDGILLAQLHTDGGPMKFSIGYTGVHAQLGHAFHDMRLDPETRVIILTGTGNSFCDVFDYGQGEEVRPTPQFFDRMFREGRDMLMNLLDIEVPVIGAINGPALIHAEIAVLSDVVLAADTAVLADVTHFANGTVPADGVHVVWPMLLGLNRGRHFLLTARKILAHEALDLGLVAEVLPPAQLLDRAWEVAGDIAAKPDLALRYTRIAFMQHIKRRMLDELGYGLALEFGASAGRRFDAAQKR